MGDWRSSIESVGTGLGPYNCWLHLTPTADVQLPIFEANSIAKVPGKNYFGVWCGMRAASGHEVDETVDTVDVVDGVGRVDDEMAHGVDDIYQVDPHGHDVFRRALSSYQSILPRCRIGGAFLPRLGSICYALVVGALPLPGWADDYQPSTLRPSWWPICRPTYLCNYS